MGERVTEHDMISALHRRFSMTVGNGPRYVCATHVRNAPGFNASRTLDFMAIDTWPSKGLLRHGIEIKCSRSDWLRELKDDTKANAFKRYCHRFWLAVPDASIVKDDLPTDWGLLVLSDDGIFRARPMAPLLRPEPFPWPMTVALARSVQTTARGRQIAVGAGRYGVHGL